MSVKEFDLLVVGAGATGQLVATEAADAGKTVAMTEGRAYGGTCPLRGCDPKLVLHAAAEAMYHVDRLRGKGFTSTPGFSWPDLMAWKRSFTEPIPQKAREKMEEHGIEVYSDYASFVDPHTMQFGDTRVKGKTIVLATGMKPAPLDIPGNEHLYHSDDFLDMDDLPAEMVVIGGGYIGTESAHVATALGCKVKMIVTESVPLDKFDHDLADLLRKSDEERGMTFHLNSKATEVRKQGNRFEVDVEGEDGSTSTVTTDRVLHCAGRVPNTDELRLDRVGIEVTDKKKIKVDQELRTTLPHVYAVGDCSDGGLPLTPVGTYEAAIVSHNLFTDKDERTDYYPIPTVAFCLPGMASVGMTAKEYKEAKDERSIKMYYKDASDWYHARHLNSPVFAYKLFVDEEKDVLLGAHLLGPGVPELINLFYLAIKEKTKVSVLKRLLWAYPTACSTVKSMLSE